MVKMKPLGGGYLSSFPRNADYTLVQNIGTIGNVGSPLDEFRSLLSVAGMTFDFTGSKRGKWVSSWIHPYLNKKTVGFKRSKYLSTAANLIKNHHITADTNTTHDFVRDWGGYRNDGYSYPWQEKTVNWNINNDAAYIEFVGNPNPGDNNHIYSRRTRSQAVYNVHASNTDFYIVVNNELTFTTYNDYDGLVSLFKVHGSYNRFIFMLHAPFNYYSVRGDICLINGDSSNGVIILNPENLCYRYGRELLEVMHGMGNMQTWKSMSPSPATKPAGTPAWTS